MIIWKVTELFKEVEKYVATKRTVQSPQAIRAPTEGEFPDAFYHISSRKPCSVAVLGISRAILKMEHALPSQFVKLH